VTATASAATAQSRTSNRLISIPTAHPDSHDLISCAP
jgi:hypothetical protein